MHLVLFVDAASQAAGGPQGMIRNINWGKVAVYAFALLFCLVWWVGFYTCLKWILE